MLLPALFLPLLLLHLYQIQRHGVAPARVPVDDPGVPGRPYHPYHTLKEAVVAIAVLSVVFVLARQLGAPLEAEADPTDQAYEPRPDWYFLAPFKLLKLFEGPYELIGSVGLPGLFALVVVLLPFLDRNPERRLGKRPIALCGGLLFILLGVGLTVLGAMDKPHHYRTPPHPLGAPPQVRLGYDLTRRGGCFACHTLTLGKGDVYGRSEHESPDLSDVEYDPETLAAFLLDPQSKIMPAFTRLSEAERTAIGVYLESLRRKKP
jgi:hypothetical protein